MPFDRRLFCLLLAAPLLACAAAPGDPPPADGTENCATIRSRIAAQTGLLAQPDTALLKQVGSHTECRFTRDEVYRAGFGDKPPIPRERHWRAYRRHHHDDD